MTKLQAMHKFADAVAGRHVTFTRATDWALSVVDSRPHLWVPFDLMKNDEGDKQFRDDFTQRCPMGRGFANVTISILHELGHHFNREEYIKTNEKEYDEATGYDHFKLPCEIVATNWAIKWLQDPEHRRLAKQFEREFFGY